LRSINGYAETESSLTSTLFDNDSRCCMVEDAKDGRLVFVERCRHHVICIDRKTHTLLWKFGRTGRQGRDDAHLSSPSACAPSPDGTHLYICDSENARVVVLCAQSGQFVSTFPASPTYFESAGWTLSMAVSSADGHVWICNPDGRSARMLASVTSFNAAGGVVCQLKLPPRSVYPAKHCSIALGRDMVFFADRREHCVFAFSATTGDLVQTIGKGPSVAKGKLIHPTCVCVLRSALYVGEAENKRVSVFNATTFEFLGLMDAPPGSDGFPSVHHISGSALTHEIFVNDLRLKQVHVFSAY
jgi:hypothetical protein